MDDLISQNMDLTYTESMQVICAFKKHAILWNPHVVGFHNRESKEEAWKIVAAESGIHPDVCKRKMKSFVSSCRREKIKIIKSRASGKPEDVYDPKWRYWNAFKFLRGLEDDDEDPLGTAPEQDILDPTMTPSWLKSRMLGKRKNTAPKPIPAPLAANQQTVAPREEDEYRTIGLTVASKLRKMYQDQRLFAENLINQALFKGMMFQLTRQSEIKTPPIEPPPDLMKKQAAACSIIDIEKSTNVKNTINDKQDCRKLNKSTGEMKQIDQKNPPALPSMSRLAIGSGITESSLLSPDDSSDFKELTTL